MENEHKVENRHKVYIGQRIRHFRNLRGMTQQGLADAIHITRPIISYIESGRQGVGIERLYELAIALEVTIGEFLPPEPPLVGHEPLPFDGD